MERKTKTRSLPSRAIIALTTVLLVLGATILAPAATSQAASSTVLGGVSPQNYDRVDNDGSVELGLRFNPIKDNTLTALRFYKANPSAVSTPASASVWSANGTRLAHTPIPQTTQTGWINIHLETPVQLTAKQGYVLSVFAKAGAYSATRSDFSSAKDSQSFTLPQNAGVFTYTGTSTFPRDVYRASNYWIDADVTSDSNTATPAPTTSPKPSTTAPTTPAPTTSPKPSTPEPGTAGLMGWQLTKDNIGLAPFGLKCDSLPLYTGSLRPAAGTRISGKLIVGNLDLRNGDIIVERSCIQPGTNPSSQALVSNYVCGADDCPVISDKSITIRDSEIDASKAHPSQIAGTCAFRGTATLQRNYMHGMGSGICFYGTGKKHDAIAEQNFVTDLRSYGESHNEAATIRDFELDQNPNRVARFTQNHFHIAEGNVTAGLFIQPTWENIDTILVDGNLIDGGGYNLFLNKAHGSYSNARATNNRFRSTGWGPSTVQGGPGWTQWENNSVYDPTKPSAAGTAVRAN